MFQLIIGKRRRCRYVDVKKHKRTKGNNVEDDKISELPDEILVFILSFMTMKEAARTSVLSRRWHKVWTFIPSLNFDTVHKLDMGVSIEVNRSKLRLVNGERLRHVNWINRVLESYQGSSIDEFRVRFDLDENHKCDIDRWVKFAREKKVKEFVMDLHKFGGMPQRHKYTFPLFCKTVRRSPSHLVWFPDYSFLRALQLKQVNVSGDGIEYLLSTCQYLVQLCITGSDSLVRLKVAGQSLCLKRLKIQRCRHLKSMYISVASLLSFKYSGRRTGISFGNVPNLVELYVGEEYGQYITQNFSQLRTFAFRLETLTLHGLHVKDRTAFLYFPVLKSLKNLKLLIEGDDDERLVALAPLIEASPSLHRFVLVFDCDEEHLSVRRRNVEKAPKCSPHPSLKVVEVLGFTGRTMDIEIITYLIENAVTLEKIIIDPLLKWMMEHPFKETYEERLIAAGRSAMQLKSKFGRKLVLRNFEFPAYIRYFCHMTYT